MRRTGFRTYACGECGARSDHHWIERNRRARMRCTSCGSARLEPVSKEGKEDILAGNTARIQRASDVIRGQARAV